KSCAHQKDTNHYVNLREVPNTDDYQLLHRTLLAQGRRLGTIIADGNCLFRSLSLFIFGHEENHIKMRQLIVNFLKDHLSIFMPYLDTATQNAQEYIKKMSLPGEWGTSCELFVAATIIQRTIYIYTPLMTTKEYQWISIGPVCPLGKKIFDKEVDKSICKFLTLCHSNGNHYDVIWPCSQCNCSSRPPQLEGIELTDKGSTVTSDKGSTVTSDKGSTVTSDKGSTVTSDKGSTVTSDKGSTVTSDKGSTVTSDKGSTVTSDKGSTVTSDKGSTVTSDKGSTVTSDKGSTVTSDKGSTVTSDKGSTVTSDKGSTVTSDKGSTVTSDKGSTVTSDKGSTVTSDKGSTVTSDKGSTVTSDKGSTVTSDKGSTVTSM
ncbi:CAunnamed protein product, partial [Biomphalaria glabrata]